MSEIEELKRLVAEYQQQIEALKNNMHTLTQRVNSANAIGAANSDAYKNVEKLVDEINEKFSNTNKIISQVKDDVKQNISNGTGSGTATFDQKELEEIVTRSIPYGSIKNIIDKHISDNFGSLIKVKEEKKSKKNSSSFPKVIMTFLVMGAIIFGAFKFYESNKMIKVIIPKGTYFSSSLKDGYSKLTKERVVLGTYKNVKTKDGVRKVFVATQIINGKKVEYRYIIK